MSRSPTKITAAVCTITPTEIVVTLRDLGLTKFDVMPGGGLFTGTSSGKNSDILILFVNSHRWNKRVEKSDYQVNIRFQEFSMPVHCENM